MTSKKHVMELRNMRTQSSSPKRVVICLISACVLLLSACSTFNQRNAVPSELRRETTVLGIPNARFFTDQPSLIVAEQERALIREAKYLHASRGGTLPTGHFLSLSGGATTGRSELVCWSAGPRMVIAPASNSSPA
jgi:hypothetical protein